MKKLICMAPNGETVSNRPEFQTTKEAWDFSGNLGSTWYFYPVHLVTGKKGKVIVDIPDGMLREWKGKRVSTLSKYFSENSQEICDWINGETSFPIVEKLT